MDIMNFRGQNTSTCDKAAEAICADADVSRGKTTRFELGNFQDGDFVIVINGPG